MSTYTGNHHAVSLTGKPEPIRLPVVLALLDHHEAHNGITYTAAQVKRARDAARAAHELRQAHAARARAADDATARGRAYLAGETTADELVEAAALAAPLLADATADTARKYVHRAAAAVEAEGVAQLHRMSEDAWLKPLRAVLAERIAQAHAEADQLAGVPSHIELRNIETRHKWERLAFALERVHDVYALADQLRRYGLLPAVPGRPDREHYRWLHLSRLTGTRPDMVREFWLANRHTAEPGVWTAEEMREADAPPVSDEPSATSESDERETVTA